MSARHGPWRLLGLAPTEDIREVRRAYAARLKAIDVDRDPQAFIALREAFEHAQHLARWMAHQREEENLEAQALEMAEGPGSLQVDLVDAPAHPPAAEPAPAAREGPWSPPTPEQFDAHAAALAQLLQRNNLEPRPWPTEAEREEMLAHWRVLIADPRLHQLDFYSDLERWIAGLLGYTIPFSDTLILPATEYFGWVRDEGMISQSDGLAEVVYRYRMLSFLDQIRTPGNRHFEAWCELTTPAGEDAVRGRVSLRKIHKLLHEVRVAYPGLEGNFEPERVALWDRRGAAPETVEPLVVDESPPKRLPRYLLWFLLLVLFVFPVIGTLTKQGDHVLPNWSITKPALPLPPPPAKLGDEAHDIALLLKAVGDGSLTLEQIGEKDPKLAQLIRSNWQIGKEQEQTLFSFLRNVSEVLNERAFDRIATASPETLTAYRTLVIDKAKALRSIAPAKCADFFQGKPLRAGDLPDSLGKRNRTMISRLLIEPAAEPRPRAGPTTFMIPNNVFRDATRRAGISEKRMGDAAMNRGSPADICNAHIALSEAAIAMPAGAERTKLLRSM
ncbi:hypothetical protein ACQKOH_10350 [Sphingomonas sp. NPDC092331]|jgi:hypothetical protein